MSSCWAAGQRTPRLPCAHSPAVDTSWLSVWICKGDSWCVEAPPGGTAGGGRERWQTPLTGCVACWAPMKKASPGPVPVRFLGVHLAFCTHAVVNYSALQGHLPRSVLALF